MEGVTGETLTDRQKYDFRRALEEIKELKGRGTELISVYVPPTKQIPDVAAYLREEFSQSSNIKSASTRKNVQGAIQSILARLKYFKAPPANGVIFFVGEVSASGDQTKMVQYVLEPPDPITTFLYRCDSDFHLEPLLDMLVDKKVFGLVVIDRSEATISVVTYRLAQFWLPIPVGAVSYATLRVGPASIRQHRRNILSDPIRTLTDDTGDIADTRVWDVDSPDGARHR